MSEQPDRSPLQPATPESPAPFRKPVQSFSGLARNPEFLETLAAAVSRGSASGQPLKRERRPRRPSLLALAAVGALLLVLAREHGWWPWSVEGTVPQVFHGTWATSAERYADRGFVITGDSLQLLTGPGRGLTYPIVGVRTDAERDATLYTLYYRDGGLDMSMRLHLEPDTTIHLVSLPLVAWTKIP
ncbi:MAG TPA: hypothetical protein VF252_08765 [Gemmatimonadales bacterium]